MEKKRRYPRVTFSALTELLISEEDTLIHAYPFSAGFGGMGLYTLRPIPVGSPLDARVFLNMGNGRQMTDTLRCVVKWCDIVGGMYRLGIEFMDMNPREHRPFLSYLKGSVKWQ